MATRKSNHFVPRTHFKPFSIEGKGGAINIFNLSRMRNIPNASIKGQCAKDYFYGRDGVLEAAFSEIEGKYGALVKRLNSNPQASENDLINLKFFSYLQYSRTEFAVKRQQAVMLGMEQLIYERDPSQNPGLDTSDEAIILLSLKMFAETYEYLSDLKTYIIKNNTDRDFITSDDPAIFWNKFLAQRMGMKNGNFGINNAGVVLTMPLSPRYLLISYDSEVYHAPKKDHSVIPTNKITDIDALNLLQVLNANENLYFQNWDQSDHIEEIYKKSISLRPAARHELHYAVKDSVGELGERYKVVHTEEERLQANEALIALETKRPTPTTFFSGLQIRTKPQFLDTKSGAGLVRKKAHALYRTSRHEA